MSEPIEQFEQYPQHWNPVPELPSLDPPRVVEDRGRDGWVRRGGNHQPRGVIADAIPDFTGRSGNLLNRLLKPTQTCLPALPRWAGLRPNLRPLHPSVLNREGAG